MLIQEMRLRDADVFVLFDVAVFLDDATIWHDSSLTKLLKYIVPKDREGVSRYLVQEVR
jgi:hypothetical protein